MDKKITFIGLGRMGLPMALNLRKAGFAVTGYDAFLNDEKRAILDQAGITCAETLADSVSEADVVITMVPADKEIKEIYLSEDGILANAKADTICIEMTSAQGVTKQLVEEEAAKKHKALKIVDAPVSGGVIGAEAGTLAIMTGCESKELFDACMPVLEAMGKKIYHTGPVGSGSNIKMLNQIFLAGNTAVAAETICVAKKLGIDLDLLRNIVSQSTGQSYVLTNFVEKYMLDEEHKPGFRLDLMKKDIGLYIDTTKQVKAFTPVAQMVYQILQASSNQGNDAKDFNCIIDWFAENQ